ncbi:response regulator receiver domain-containing protein 4 [Elsinoe australis]|uniref:histidine kinase n=1 Tax=Elsinoe australis TaxID=40998 RepID=A0A4U7B658_9PEZI|nr:response regulator receiver domain-containing protein 4 [Elsinoe australis]
MAGGAVVLDQTTRKTICLSQPQPDLVIHDGDSQFSKELGKLYTDDESRALEGLVELKQSLKNVSESEFWSHLSERLAELLGAQMSFVSKRMLVDEQDRAVEMPPIGEPGACLMASAMYYNEGVETPANLKAFKYHAYGCPCGYMRHDKVFVIPEKLGSFITDNPNAFPFTGESYIGVPLFAEGKCFAHFGVMWSVEGAKKRKLSWANTELFLHSLEDIILERLLEGSNFRDGEAQSRDRARIIPHAAVTAAQSLKPYARSLSHELRTPMQGVVGMLDIMMSTVLEAYENQRNPEVRRIFETLKENIEIVQDSSRRAVEAADNVVHAYDMDMHIPEPLDSAIPGENLTPINSAPIHDRPGILVAGSNLPIQRPNKRRRGDEGSNTASPAKIPATMAEWTKRTEPSQELVEGVHEAEDIRDETRPANGSNPYEMNRVPSPPKGSERSVAPGLRHTQLRNVLQYVVNEGLKVGGRPEYANAHETDLGECIEVRTTKGTGEIMTKTVEWSVDPSVPTTMFVEEKDLGKLISCVVLNAIKFTEQGKIEVSARMSSRSRHIVISVSDSGPGIPKAFLPKLFKPFSQEDPSLTRQSEGLGLGLLVAKGLARKLGGDLMCARTETEGPNQGTDFEIRIPVSPADHISRPPSPFDSPSSRSRKFPTRNGERSPNPPAPQETKNPFPTPTEEPSELKHSLGPRPSLASLMRKPSLPQTPRLEKIDKLGFQLPAVPPSPSPKPNKPTSMPQKRPPMMPRKSSASLSNIDRDLASKYPLSFLVAEDNKINRKLLVSMLTKFGYQTIHEAYDGAEAVRQMEKHGPIDVVLMDLWMPFMDGYEATQKILDMDWRRDGEIESSAAPTVLAVTADVTDGALEKAAKVGMKGFMTKPFKLMDLQRLILEYCSQRAEDSGVET